MQERVIENWLINANELSFTIPFSQVLALQGHTILNISPKKATLEQGKDIITRDREGKIYCYQLKGGNISLSNWWGNIKPQIEELTNLPPKHPSITDNEDWECILVVNGNFIGEASRGVSDLQEAWRREGKKVFSVIVQDELRQMFVDAYQQYLPDTLKDFTLFMDLYRHDGRELLNKPQFSEMLESFFEHEKGTSSKRALQQKINASIVSVSYLLAKKYNAENHIGILEGWLMLQSYIFAIIEKNQLEKKYWNSSVELIQQAIDATIQSLIEEIKERKHFAEIDNKECIPYADAYVYKLRVTTMAGYLSGYCLFKYLKDEKIENEDVIINFLDSTTDLLTIYGEGEIPNFVNIALYHKILQQDDKCISLLSRCISSILVMKGKGGLYDPYINPQDIIRTFLGITLKPEKYRLGSNSYMLFPLILVLAMLKNKEFVSDIWRMVSHISIIDFVPKEKWQWGYWNCRSGNNESRFPKKTQSWAELQELSKKPSDKLPECIQKSPQWLGLFFCLMPHRLSSYAIRNFICAISDKIKK